MFLCHGSDGCRGSGHCAVTKLICCKDSGWQGPTCCNFEWSSVVMENPKGMTLFNFISWLYSILSRAVHLGCTCFQGFLPVNVIF